MNLGVADFPYLDQTLTGLTGFLAKVTWGAVRYPFIYYFKEKPYL
jgi:hypothetical protein